MGLSIGYSTDYIIDDLPLGFAQCGNSAYPLDVDLRNAVESAAEQESISECVPNVVANVRTRICPGKTPF